jgi:hypothetical protein
MLLIRLSFPYFEAHNSSWFLAAFVPKFSDCTPLMRQFLIGTLATFRLYISQILARLNRLANCPLNESWNPPPLCNVHFTAMPLQPPFMAHSTARDPLCFGVTPRPKRFGIYFRRFFRR